VLGFKMNWRDDDGNSFASVSRGDCHLSRWAIRAIQEAGCGSE
jgi:hypothetical protein